jgi:hypothetical protein
MRLSGRKLHQEGTRYGNVQVLRAPHPPDRLYWTGRNFSKLVTSELVIFLIVIGFFIANEECWE